MQHVRTTDRNFIREVSLSSNTKVGRQPIHRILMPFPVAYFTGALATDVAYWPTAEVMWERFSVWLITAGLIMVGAAIIAAVIDLARGGQKPVWLRIAAYAFAVLLALMNVFVHSRDGYTAVVPTGLVLSGLVVLVSLATASAGWALTSPRRVGAYT